MQKYILSLDAGTTSNRAILFNHSGEIVAVLPEQPRRIVFHNGSFASDITRGNVKQLLKQSRLETEMRVI